MKRAKNEIGRMKDELGIYVFSACDKEKAAEYGALADKDEELPDNVYMGGSNAANADIFYEHKATKSLNSEELREYLMLRQTLYLKSIKNCAVFFVAFTIISMCIGLAAWFGFMFS